MSINGLSHHRLYRYQALEMSLTTLPPEIHNLIFFDGTLSRYDYKALRLSSRRFRTIFDEVLFRRVRVSLTRKDLGLLLQMTRRPELAGLVEELVWYEFRPEFLNPDLVIKRRKKAEMYDDTGARCFLTDGRTPVFKADYDYWCATVSYPGLRSLQEEFFSAVAKMPRLNGFTSMPVPSEHDLDLKPGLLTARTFYEGLFIADKVPNLKHKRAATHLCPATGFEGFLRPAMARFGPKVERLQLVDPPWVPRFHHRPDTSADGFEYLTDLTLCVDWWFQRTGIFTECLMRAEGLRRLRICNRPGQSVAPWFAPSRQGVHFGCFAQRLWPNLETLELVSVSLRTGDMYDVALDTAAYTGFLEDHAPTLRHLRLDRCSFDRVVAEQTALVEGLNLETLRICEPRSDKAVLVDEQELRASVNGPAKFWLGIKNLSPDDVLSTFPAPSEGEMSKCHDASVICSATDPGLGLRTDGHTLRDYNPWWVSDYARHKSEHGATKWKLGMADGMLFYWPSDESDAYNTSMFLFHHRNEDELLGTDPLEHFDDWDSDDGGDWAEPVPIGNDLLNHTAEANRGRLWHGPLPPGAIEFHKYDFSDDSGGCWRGGIDDHGLGSGEGVEDTEDEVNDSEEEVGDTEDEVNNSEDEGGEQLQ